ncbi:putative gpi-anchored cell surface glycoprotein [Golovinomyces cichoracearum]|uniref:Putative gpi-anchored cell surface glycoprotein n=1 Tax=Golovinomyces cichoracearum TaxID=62708 RepID=A0A420IGZ0_9PEZI|nr:putative gpi-anchored cell surface glycoprotein [Golovinomyces cichoracearum]
MRTRATGQSPGGFHVLASPKRVRRQPPPPVRSSRTSSKASEVEKSEASQVHHATASIPAHKDTFSNGDASQHHPSSQKEADVIDIAPKNQTSIPHTKEYDSKFFFSKQKRDNHAEDIKNSGAKKRSVSTKKKRPEHNFIKVISSQDINDAMIKNTAGSESNLSPRGILRECARPVLGKRQRCTSDDYLTSENMKEISSLKRTRVNYNNSNSTDIATDEYSISVPQDNFEIPQFAINNSHSPHFKLSQQTHDKTIRQTLSVDSTSPYHSSRETQQEQITASKLNSSCRTRLINQNPKNSLPSLGLDQKKDVETHLKLGMQSIMSRMNKYQYQPLPKNPYKPLSEIGLSALQVPALDAKKGQVAKLIKSPSKSPISTSTEITQPQADTSGMASSRDSENNLSEEKLRHQKQSEWEQKQTDVRTSKKIPDKLKDRRMEVEKLFRSTAPNASYQNILRAVAEWAVHNSSKIPTKDEIFTYVESSKAPDATELFSTTDGMFLRGSPSKMRKVSETSNILSKSTKSKIAKNNSLHNSRICDSKSWHSTDKKNLSRPTNSDSIEAQGVSIISPHNPDDHEERLSCPETPSNSKTQPAKTLKSQSWGLVNTFKNIVSTPFKVLSFGFGFNENNEAVQDVTKDIDFAFKQSVTQSPNIRTLKKNRAVSQNKNRPRMPGRAVEKNKSIYLPPDPFIHQDSTQNTTPLRRTVTQKRKFELQHELELKKLKIREKNLIDDTDYRHKRPVLKSKHGQSRLYQDSHANTSHSGPRTVVVKNNVEEWPPNLDPNRKVLDLAMASQKLPRGPNGEDVATMLCKGWLISKYRDSFVREIRDSVDTSSLVTKSYRVPPCSTLIQTDQSCVCDAPNGADVKNVEGNLENQIIPQEETIKTTQPGRSYGFDYDDDSSSSDDEENFVEKKPLNSDIKNSYVKENIVATSQINLNNGPYSSPNKNSSMTSSTQPLEKIDNRSSPPPFIPSIPHMSSSLRHSGDLSPHSANSTTSSNQSNHAGSPTPVEESKSLTVVTDHDVVYQYADGISDWSYMCDIDPRMAHFNPGIIDAVESLPKDSFPGVQLPPLIKELI